MAFKMKGPSIHKGTAKHKSLIEAHKKHESLFQMKSSAVPYTKRSMLRNEEDIKWGKEELISEEQYTTPEGVTGVEKIFTTQGVKTTTKQDPALVEFNKRCAKFGGVNSPEAAAAGCVWDETKIDPEPIITKEDLEKKRVERTEDVPELEPEPEPKEKKWCHCKTYAQRQAWQGASTQRAAWAKYECGTDLPPECIKPKRKGDTKTGFIETSEEEKQKQTTFEGRIPG